MQKLKKLLASTKAKFIFVSGGVISGLGKGTTVAAISAILKDCGLKVFPVKVDMYLNQDAGTMNPLEHGETFVTKDGLECDQDLGTYERFLHTDLNRSNYFTAGQIYQSVLNKERQLKYNGACVEAFPHIPKEIINFIFRFPKDSDIVIVEYGGTVGEFQNEAFFEAARMMVSASPNQVCFIHIGYVLNPPSLGEAKSKPMQMSIKALNQTGIFPDLVICRSEKPIDKPRIEKIAIAAGLPEDHVFSCPNVNSIYKLPKLLKDQNILHPIFEKLQIKNENPCKITKWENLYEIIDKKNPKVKIGIVGKYYTSGTSSLQDSYISVIEAIKHAAWKLDINPEIVWFDSEKIEKNLTLVNDLAKIDAVIVPQGWGSRGSQGKIKAIEFVRTNKIPYLGLCYGMQMASIEFARNVLGLKNANSEEVDSQTKYPIIHTMDSQKEFLKNNQFGGTIRLGEWPCLIKKGSYIEKLYKNYSKLPNNNIVGERHRHRYEFNNTFREQFEKEGFLMTGTSPDNNLVEAIELNQSLHPFFIATQFHPELISRPFDPHPLFLGLIEAILKNKI